MVRTNRQTKIERKTSVPFFRDTDGSFLIILYVLHTLLQYLCDVLGLQVKVACGIADGAFGNAGNHVGGSTNLADGERQTDFLHPGFQGIKTLLGYLLVGLSIGAYIPYVLGEAYKLGETGLHGTTVVGH